VEAILERSRRVASLISDEGDGWRPRSLHARGLGRDLSLALTRFSPGRRLPEPVVTGDEEL